MRVLHFCVSYGWGGLEMASAQWAGLFAKNGHESHSICSPGSSLSKRLKEAQLPFEEMEFREYFSPRSSWRLRQYVIENKIDAVFLQSLRDLWVVSPALVGLPVHLIGFAQMWLEGINKKDLLHSLIHRRMDQLITLTPRQGEQVLRCIPYDTQKTTILPNAIDPSRFSPNRRSEKIRHELGATEKDILIGLVGRLDRQKGQREALESFGRAHLAAPDLPLKFVLVGEPTAETGTAYYDELQKTVRELGIGDRVTFAGFRADIPDVMASLDIFLLNSYREAFGFVIVEAMMSGAAVIATNSGGVPDVLGDGQYGTLVPPQDIPALATAFLNLARDRDHRQAVAEKARLHAIDHYDENKNFQRMMKVLKSLPPRRRS